LTLACSKDNEAGSSSDWLIPEGEVRDGGPGKDGIPAISSPNFSSIAEIDFLDPTDIVIAVKTTEGVRAYPHPVLDWHEIANDDLPSGERLSFGTIIQL